MLTEKLIDLKRSKIRQSPCHTNRASELGHPCERFLVFRRTRWQDAILHDVSLQFLFDEGSLHEQAVLRELNEAGVPIIEQQRDYEDKATLITGHVDGKIPVEGAAYPLEIKSMSPYIWQRIETVDDLMTGPVHLRKYPAQLQLYMLLSNSEKGVLLLKNKATGQVKELWMDLDLDFAESLLKKAERINAHVAAGTVPAPIEYDEAICGRCAFQHVCLPDVKRDAMDLLTDPDIEAKLTRRAELEPLKKEFESLDKEIKGKTKDVEKAIIGDFLITGKKRTRTGYTVAPSEFWETKISKLTVTKGAEDE